MAQENIDFGDFPNDPDADAIRLAFQKTQNNFSELFNISVGDVVTSLTPGKGGGTGALGVTIVNSSGAPATRGDLQISADIARLDLLSTGRTISFGSGIYNKTITASDTINFDVNPVLKISNLVITGNLNPSNNLSNLTISTNGNITTNGTISANGSVKLSGGSSTAYNQIQYNNGGLLDGNNNLQWLNSQANLQVTGNINIVSGGNANVSGNVNIDGGGLDTTNPTQTFVLLATPTNNLSFAANAANLTISSSVDSAVTLGNSGPAGYLKVTATTTATNSTTGALRVAGGVGIVGNTYIAANANIAGFANVSNTTDSISTTTGAIVTAGGVGIVKSVFIGGNANVTGNIYAASGTDSTNTTSGALQTAGGLGVVKSAFIGGNANVTGNIYAASGTDSTSTVTGALQTAGGLGVVKSAYIGGNANVAGNATITGTQTFTGATTHANTVTGITGGTQSAASVSAQSLRVAGGGMGIVGDSYINGSLGVATNITAGGNLSVTGNATITGTQTLTGATTFGSTATGITGGTASSASVSAQSLRVAGGGMGIVGASYINGALGVNGGVTATYFTGDGANITTANASNLTSGTVPNNRTYTTGVAAQTYGNATAVSQFNVDIYGRITSAGNVLISNIALGSGSGTGTVAVGGTATFAGTTNRITTSAGSQTVTFNTPQDLHTGASFQVASLGVGTGPSGTTGEIRATNNITAYYSDDRLKTKLGPIEAALDKVKQLSGFYYEANETAQALGYEVKREVGVSAQEVQRVQPETVAPAPIDDKYLTVRYERLIPLLIEAIKELDSKIEELKGNNQ